MKDSPRLQVGYRGAAEAVGVIFWKKEAKADHQETPFSLPTPVKLQTPGRKLHPRPAANSDFITRVFAPSSFLCKTP